jgi:hypothetical protein
MSPRVPHEEEIADPLASRARFRHRTSFLAEGNDIPTQERPECFLLQKKNRFFPRNAK